MTPWQALQEELDAWAEAGRCASLWWRDDDAVEATPALDRLLALAARHDVPLALAVIPARASRALARRIAGAGPRIALLQHGYAHRNHAPPSEKKAELGAHRPETQVFDDLARGAERMSALFGSDWLRILVPPWNRIAAAHIPALPDLGLRGLSADGARHAARAAPGLVQVNSHVDIMRWEQPRGFLGAEATLALLIRHLRDRRTGTVDEFEPTGLLTHHLVHDQDCWNFLEDLLPRLVAHPAVRFLNGLEVFGQSRGVEPGRTPP